MASVPESSTFTFAVARSNFLDAQAAVEEAVILRLRRLGQQPKPLLSQNVEALAKAKPAPQFSKATKKQIDDALALLKPIQDTRHAIVHGKMATISCYENDRACFVNPQHACDDATRATLLTKEQFVALTNSLQRIARTVNEA